MGIAQGGTVVARTFNLQSISVYKLPELNQSSFVAGGNAVPPMCSQSLGGVCSQEVSSSLRVQEMLGDD